ncbi:MAG TPA: hypothetical protein VGF14_02650 [Alphaproteobacteria bacterium]
MSYASRLSLPLSVALCFTWVLAAPALAQESAAKNANQAAAGNVQITKPIYPWRTETSQKDDPDNKGKKIFSHCMTKNMYDNGILLLIAENSQHQRRLALHFPQDKLTPSDKYALQWQVDRQDSRPVTAIAASPRILAVAIDDAMTQQIMRGNMLFLRGPNDTLVFDMMGVNDAVQALQNCLTTEGVGLAAAAPVSAPPPPSALMPAQIAPPAMPAAAPEAVADAAKNQPVEDKGSNALSLPVSQSATARKATYYDPFPQAMGDLFNRARLKPRELTLVPEAEREGKPFDAVWTQGNLFIGVKTDRPVPHQALMQIAATFTGKLQQLCGGEFLAEAGETEKRGDARYLMPVEVACSPADPAKGRNTIAAVLFDLDTQALRVYFIEAPEKYGNQAIQARDRVMGQIR